MSSAPATGLTPEVATSRGSKPVRVAAEDLQLLAALGQWAAPP
ncbi:MAG: hypothetical protein QM747_09710 [Nocardioides sp.]